MDSTLSDETPARVGLRRYPALSLTPTSLSDSCSPHSFLAILGGNKSILQQGQTCSLYPRTRTAYLVSTCGQQPQDSGSPRSTGGLCPVVPDGTWYQLPILLTYITQTTGLLKPCASHFPGAKALRRAGTLWRTLLDKKQTSVNCLRLPDSQLHSCTACPVVRKPVAARGPALPPFKSDSILCWELDLLGKPKCNRVARKI